MTVLLLQVENHLMWMLGTEPGPFATISVLNHQATVLDSLDFKRVFFPEIALYVLEVRGLYSICFFSVGLISIISRRKTLDLGRYQNQNRSELSYSFHEKEAVLE